MAIKYVFFVFSLVGIVLAFVSAICIYVLVQNYYSWTEKRCYALWQDSGMEVKWDAYGGCRLKVDNVWIPSDTYKVTP